MSLLGSIQKVALAPSVFLGNTISNVIKPGSGRTTTAQLQSTIPGKLLGTAIAGTALTAGALALPAGSLATGAKSLVPTTLKGKIIGAAALPVGIGILSKNPAAPIQAASQLGEFGSDIGSFTLNPNLTTFTDVIKGSPIISAGAAAAGLGLTAGMVIPAIASFQNTRATRANTRAILDSGSGSLPGMTEDDLVSYPEQEEYVTEQESKPKTRRKTRLKPQYNKISQRVDVRVNSISGNRKYIKNVLQH